MDLEYRKGLGMTRETKFGIALAGSFLLVAGGIMGVKTFLKDPPPAVANPEPKALAQLPPKQEADKPVTPGPLEIPPKKPTINNEGGVIIPDLDTEILGQPKKQENDKFTFRTAREKENAPLEIPDLRSDKLPPLELTPIEIPTREDTKKTSVIRVRADELPPLEEPKEAPKNSKLEPIEIPDSPPPAVKKKEEKLELPLEIPDLDKPMKEKKVELSPLKIDLEPIQPKVSGISIRPVADKKETKKDEPRDIEVPDIKIVPKKSVELPPLEDPDLKFGQPKKSTSIQPLENPDKVEAKRNEDTFDEDMHSLRTGDTYSSISKLHYRSEAYSLALQKYNGDNPNQAQYIRIPPVWVLETRYKRDITGGLQQDTASSPAPAEAKRQNPVYEVAANGEFLAEIAQKTLGNEDAWQRIKELNKNINEVKRIPGGTRLILPVEARIPGN